MKKAAGSSGQGGREATVAVVGLGSSGEAAARLALAKGATVHVTDESTGPAVTACGARLRDLGARVGLGQHDVEAWAEAETIVVSPGIPPDAPVLEALRSRGIGWISEPEFAFRFFRSPLIAITGTNGKTTTAAFCAHLLREAGVNVALGGNIGSDFGPPASEIALMDPPPDWIVLELSSFQLADIDTLTPDIGVLTNLGADHLDRYDSIEAYHADKRRLVDAGTDKTLWVLNEDDPAVMEMAEGASGDRWGFSLNTVLSPGAYLSGDTLTVDFGQAPYSVASRSSLRLLGAHNVANALAAILAACGTGTPLDLIRPAVATFRPMPHRLELVAERSGVTWVNDSKATNVSATAGALGSLEGPIVLLLGGKDKGEDFRGLIPALLEKVRVVVAYGEAGRRIEEEIESDVDVRHVSRSAGSFDDAVGIASELVLSGETLLLSPACSSYDQFADYTERGERFRELAKGASS
ncbi:MAG: UDP-N-acetylmuramoyl-L-alanine--D-glutamate ligase [Longimicrobiales bacterium]